MVYKKHLQYIQSFWNNILVKKDTVIDATVGNGYDCLFLCQKVLLENSGFVFGYDIQSEAIENTQKKLQESLPSSYLSRVKLLKKSHESFCDVNIKDIKLITYNLGYLPGSDKTVLTTAETTILSLKNALLLKPKFISIVCYPGHPQGLVEEDQLSHFLTTLPSDTWVVSWKKWVNKKRFPSVFILENIEI